MNHNNYEQIIRQFEKARSRRREWDILLDDAYRYALPNHDPRSFDSKGKQRDIEVYDNTAVEAVQMRKAKLHGQLFPPFQEWMEFKIDSLIFDKLYPEEQGQINDYLALIKENFHNAITKSNFHIEIDPALGDACISTGALLIHANTENNPLRFESVPIAQIIPEETADGYLKNVYREWKMPLQEILDRWPDAQLSKEILQDKMNNSEQDYTVVEAWLNVNHDGPYYDGACHYMAFINDFMIQNTEIKPFVERVYDICPIIVFRIDKAPGEWMGRGPVLNILGDIKTLNKAVELVLKNATIAVTGIWLADDDGVLNPSNIRLIPGAIIPKAVGSNGLTPLQSPAKFDISQLIITDLQEKIRKAIAGSNLPDLKSGIRTALEIDLRAHEQEQLELPTSLRLLSELEQPLALRVLAILSSPAMAGSPYYVGSMRINQELIKPRPISPLVKLQKRADAARAFQAYQQANIQFADLIPQLVDRSEYLYTYLKDSGFPIELLRSPKNFDMADASIPNIL